MLFCLLFCHALQVHIGVFLFLVVLILHFIFSTKISGSASAVAWHQFRNGPYEDFFLPLYLCSFFMKLFYLILLYNGTDCFTLPYITLLKSAVISSAGR